MSMAVPSPSIDPFYAPAAPPRPGEILRLRPVDVTTATPTLAWQMVYGSTGTLGRPIAVSGTLFVPTAPHAGPRPVLGYGVGVHGLGRDCAPSYLMRLGLEAELPLVDLALARGWAVAVTDGEGLGMPGPHTYGAGRSGGHAVLDIARASLHSGADLAGGAPLVVWGYSEGGRCAAWAAELAPTYAPELNLVGVAAGGVPSDLRAAAKAIDGGPFSGLGLAVLVGLTHAYREPALERILSDAGRAAARHAATLDVTRLITEHPGPMRQHTVRDEPWDEPAWRVLLDRERNGRRRPSAPVYLYHVVDDTLVPTELGRVLAADYEALGADVTWVPVRAPDHLSGAVLGAGDAVAWLAEALATAGVPT
jgi:hypothetical protein